MALEVWWARPTARTTMPSECSKQLQSGLPVSTLWTHCICDALHEKHCSYLGLAPGGSAGGVLVAPRHAPAMWGQLLRCHAPPPPPGAPPPLLLAGCRPWAWRPAPRTPPPPAAPSPTSSSPRRPRGLPTTWRRSRRHWRCGTAPVPLCSPPRGGCTPWRTARVGRGAQRAAWAGKEAGFGAGCCYDRLQQGQPMGMRPIGVDTPERGQAGAESAGWLAWGGIMHPCSPPCWLATRASSASMARLHSAAIFQAQPCPAPAHACSLRRGRPHRQARRQRAHRPAAGGRGGGAGGGRQRGAPGGAVPRHAVSTGGCAALRGGAVGQAGLWVCWDVGCSTLPGRPAERLRSAVPGGMARGRALH